MLNDRKMMKSFNEQSPRGRTHGVTHMECNDFYKDADNALQNEAFDAKWAKYPS